MTTPDPVGERSRCRYCGDMGKSPNRRPCPVCLPNDQRPPHDESRCDGVVLCTCPCGRCADARFRR